MHRGLVYWASLNEPAISEIVLLKINPSQIGKLYQHFLIFIRIEMMQFFPINWAMKEMEIATTSQYRTKK